MNLLILSGKNEQPYFVEGWYGLERSPEGLFYRAAKPKANIRLAHAGTVELIFYGCARPQHTGKLLETAILVDATRQAACTVDSNHWVIRSMRLQLKQDSVITLQCRNPWSPDALYQNGDIRALGLLISAVRVQSKR